MHHTMEDEEIFSFEHDDEDFGGLGKGSPATATTSPSSNTIPFIQITRSNSNCYNGSCDSRLANFDHEEIVTLRPRNSFSFDILALDSKSHLHGSGGGGGAWPSSRRASNNNNNTNEKGKVW